MKRITVLLGAGILLLCSMTFAAVPRLINFQGILKDVSGNPVANGSYSVIFKIYDAPSGGSVLWSETRSVTTSNGLFTVLLGASNPVPDNIFIDSSRYLGITVSPDPEMTPRQKLVSVAYGYRVNSVDGASGGNITGNVGVAGDIYLRGSGANDVLALKSTGDPNIAIELRSGTTGGDPYIDFSNDPATDFDARIQLQGNDGLQIAVPSILSVPTGHVGIGTTTPGSLPGLQSARLELADEDGSNSEIAQRVAGISGFGAHYFFKSRGTLASPTIVQSGDVLGGLIFFGHNGTDFTNPAAWVRAAVDGTPGANDMPGRLEFMTTPDGSATSSIRMTINSAGNVGIGTGSPGAKLHVASHTSYNTGSTYAVAASDSANQALRLSVGYDAGLDAGVIQASQEFVTFNKSLLLNPNAGNVGIGTIAPEQKLHVFKGSAGTVTADPNSVGVFENSTHSYLSILAPSASERGVLFGDNLNPDDGGIIYTGTSNRMEFRTNGNSTRMVIDSGGSIWNLGKVLISDGAGVPAAPQRTLQLASPETRLNLFSLLSSAFTVTEYRNSDGQEFHTGLGGGSVGNGVANKYYVYDATAGQFRVVIDPSGNVGVGTTTPGFKLDVAGSAHATSFPTSSDLRLKKNIEPLTNVLEKLERIRGVSFDWNEVYEKMGRSSGHREIGVIAQDVEKVFPELVSKWGEEQYRGVDYGRMTAVLIEAVKEQQKQIEELKTEIAKLKSVSSHLQARN